ncbi:MAG: hypothetical protein SFV51_28755 [Bryobacteraceae bacterium]|nr:hypothetical protein [Bryobacteraceae bacterium]
MTMKQANPTADGAAGGIQELVDDAGRGSNHTLGAGRGEVPRWQPLPPDEIDLWDEPRPPVLRSEGVPEPAVAIVTAAAAPSLLLATPQPQDPVPGQSSGPFPARLDLPVRQNEVPQVQNTPVLTFRLKPTQPPTPSASAEARADSEVSHFTNEAARPGPLELSSRREPAAPGPEPPALRTDGDFTGVRSSLDSQSPEAGGGEAGPEPDARHDQPDPRPEAAEPPVRSFLVAESALEARAAGNFPRSEAIAKESGPPIPEPIDSSPVAKVEQARRASGQVKQVRLDLGTQSQDLSLTFRERGGQVEIAVHSPDRGIRQTLQSEVSDLVGQLERAGYEVDLSAIAPPPDERAPQRQPTETGGGLDAFADSRRRDAQDEQPRHRRRQHPRPEGWKQILEETQWRIQ